MGRSSARRRGSWAPPGRVPRPTRGRRERRPWPSRPPCRRRPRPSTTDLSMEPSRFKSSSSVSTPAGALDAALELVNVLGHFSLLRRGDALLPPRTTANPAQPVMVTGTPGPTGHQPAHRAVVEAHAAVGDGGAGMPPTLLVRAVRSGPGRRRTPANVRAGAQGERKRRPGVTGRHLDGSSTKNSPRGVGVEACRRLP